MATLRHFGISEDRQLYSLSFPLLPAFLCLDFQETSWPWGIHRNVAVGDDGGGDGDTLICTDQSDAVNNTCMVYPVHAWCYASPDATVVCVSWSCECIYRTRIYVHIITSLGGELRCIEVTSESSVKYSEVSIRVHTHKVRTVVRSGTVRDSGLGAQAWGRV
jgi:hypothetical protein